MRRCVCVWGGVYSSHAVNEGVHRDWGSLVRVIGQCHTDLDEAKHGEDGGILADAEGDC